MWVHLYPIVYTSFGVNSHSMVCKENLDVRVNCMWPGTTYNLWPENIAPACIFALFWFALSF